MNVVMRTKLETCLELSNSAEQFREYVLKVTGLTHSGFRTSSLTSEIYKRLHEGEDKHLILTSLF